MSTRRIAVPPGRAGRLWLERRLGVARRGADVLERKLSILQAELSRAREAAAAAAAEWERMYADADLRLLRASLLGGRRSIRLGTGAELAEVTVRFADVMGVRLPASGACASPPGATWDGPALSQARLACQEALAAAVRSAVATEALRRVEAEVTATRYRLRAVRDRWIPELEQAMAEVTFAIEETELADAARLRLARLNRRR